jgi:N-methylhydantoinase A
MAYGLGGDQPSVTDAHVVLERLPESLVGGVELNAGAAREGVGLIARELGLTVERAAEGILELSAHNQANAVLQLTVKRGIDPSGDALVAFGGAGPLQATRIAELLSLKTVLIPPSPGNVSAFGLLAVDLKDDYVITLVQRHDSVDSAAVAQAFTTLEEMALGSLAAQGVRRERILLQRSVDARYLGEAHELPVAFDGDFDVEAATTAFHDAHERVYGYAYRTGEVVEFVNWKVTGLGLIERPRLEVAPPAGSGRPKGSRRGFAVYDRGDLPAGFEGRGPAIVEEYGSTTVVEEGFAIEVDSFGNLVLRNG